MSTTLSRGYHELILSIRPNYALTLGEGPGLNPITAQERIRHFLNKVQRCGLGRNWHNKPPEMRLKAVGFREHHLTNPHWHLAVCAPGDLGQALHLCKADWPKMRFKGHAWADVIDVPRNYSSYIRKSFFVPETADNPFIYGCR